MIVSFVSLLMMSILSQRIMGAMCDFCPGVLVDLKFDCTRSEYHYIAHPKEFRRRLHQLNKKRIGAKV